LNRARTVPTSASAQTTPDLAAEETRDRAHARAVIEEIVEGFQALGDSLLEHVAPGLLDDFGGAYGAEPATLWAEVLHQLRLRLRSVGFSHVGRESGITLRA
jgi:hypothetical protein